MILFNMKKININKIISIFVFTLFALFVSVHSYAQALELVPSDGKENGDYGVNDFVLVAVNISKWILMISGSFALLAFIVGGFMFILSGGNREWVEKGKASLIGSSIGLLVVLLAFVIINYFMKKIGFVGGVFGDWNSTN